MAAESGSGQEGRGTAPLIWSSRAIADVAEIGAYLTRESPALASRMAVAIVAAGDSLERYPLRGSPGQWHGTRRLLVMRRYSIFYRVVAGRVEILTVRHAARRPL